MTQPILEVTDLKTHFPIRQGIFRRQTGTVLAVDGVTLYVDPHETLGVVGESGCGKTTLGRSILRLIEPTAGTVTYRGEDVTAADKERMRQLRKEMQIVFQDPYASLNPRMPVRDIIAEPLRIHGMDRKQAYDRVGALLGKVGMMADHGNRYPHEFSGGQRQRIGIARALVLDPSLIILDEPVSALDVSIQAQVINLLMDLQQEKRLSYLFIAHDLAVVKHISHRIAVMYLGRIVELADTRTLFANPQHPYTEALLAAVPIPKPRLKRKRRLLQGDVPSPIRPPPGCRFHTRCPYAEARCRQEMPAVKSVGPGHLVACHLR